MHFLSAFNFNTPEKVNIIYMFSNFNYTFLCPPSCIQLKLVVKVSHFVSEYLDVIPINVLEGVSQPDGELVHIVLQGATRARLLYRGVRHVARGSEPAQ